MPLTKGYSKNTVAKNIRRMMREGKDHDQAVAIAMHEKEAAEKKKGRKKAKK